MKRGYVPDSGDLVWVSFDPQSGHEQAGRRPALVISPHSYNEKVGLALACRITSKVKGYPFEVALPSDLPVSGVILADQIKSLDWKARRAEFVARTPVSVIEDVRSLVLPLIGEEG